jgi:hypothetical protein
MKNLVLNNYNIMEMEEELVKLLETHFIENREVWVHFNEAFWKENREESSKRLLQLQTGDNIVCSTVFEGYGQLELLSLLLMSKEMPEGINIYIMHNHLKDELQEYFDQRYSDIQPNTKEYDNSYELQKQFKENMNTVVQGALLKHNLYEMKRWGDPDNSTKITF